MYRHQLILLLLMTAFLYPTPQTTPLGITQINGTAWPCCNLASFGQPIETFNGYQYTVFYDNSGKVCVGRRDVLDTLWDTLQIRGYTTATSDGHNTPVIGLSPIDGTIHLAFDHHNDPLHYTVSKKGVLFRPDTLTWEGALFGPVQNSSVMPTLNVVTYPHFLKRPDGILQFFTRLNGGSGNADWALWEYQPDSSKWKSVGLILSQWGTYTWPDGFVDNDRCAYPNGYTYHGNRLHLTWCWREDCCRQNANHDLLYAYSDDFGRTWKNSAGDSAGAAGTNTMKLTTTGIKVWDIPVNRGYINQVCQNVDSKGRIHVVTWHVGSGAANDQGYYPAQGTYFHYWRDTTGLWYQDSLFAIQERCKLLFDDSDNAFLVTKAGIVYTAEAASRWTGWKQVINVAIGAGEPTVDFGRWQASRVLTLFSSSLKTADFAINDSTWPRVRVQVKSMQDSSMIEGAYIRFFKNSTFFRGTCTNDTGNGYAQLSSASYTLTVNKSGFQSAQINALSFENGTKTSLTVYLQQLSIKGMKVVPDSAALHQDDSLSLSVRVVYSDNSVAPSKEGVTWFSRNADLVSVDATGLLRSHEGAGTTWIVGSMVGGFQDSIPVTVGLMKTITPLADAYVRDGSYATAYYGRELSLMTKSGSSDYNRRSYFTFDLSSLAQVSTGSAKLRLFVTATDVTTSMPVTLYSATDTAWKEDSICWNNRPLPVTPLDTAMIDPTIYTAYEWDVSGWIALNKGKSAVSLCLMDTTHKGNNVVFASKENTTEPPRLIVTLVPSTKTSLASLSRGKIVTIAPNPFNPVTQVSFPTTKPEERQGRSLFVFSANGQKIADLSPDARRNDTVFWDGSRYASGVYLMLLHVSGKTVVFRTTLLK